MKFSATKAIAFWSVPVEQLQELLASRAQGLTQEEAKRRLQGVDVTPPSAVFSHTFRLLLGQFSSPIVLILIFAAGLSFLVHDRSNALIILGIVLVSGLLGFWQERGAADAVAKLLALVQVSATVIRSNDAFQIPITQVVIGDIILLKAGDKIPGDSYLLESKDLYVNEAMLTGETYPAEKAAGVLPPETPLSRRTNSLFMGTNVISGSAKALVVRVGRDTEFGQVSEHLQQDSSKTEFERGIQNFGYLLAEVTLVLVLAIFAMNVFLHRPVLDAFLFALALAVGLTPQLLPAIISINLAHGARRMAKQKVIVKRLAAIENFGSMDVLCSDKTGTLTEGVVHLRGALDMQGQPNDKALLFAYLNASYETGFANPIDEAILSYRPLDISKYRKLDEIPYDFLRKRLSIAVADDSSSWLITKGSLSNVLEVCTHAEMAGDRLPLESVKGEIEKQFEQFSEQGLRTLGLAYRELVGEETTSLRLKKKQETEMIFLGFLILADPPKKAVHETVLQLQDLGVSLKMITGDNRLVAARVGREIGLDTSDLLAGPDLARMSDEALSQRVGGVGIFAEIEPNQKERIILALRRAGHVVGYLGDGINDASALHAADVGISVASAVDVAKEAAEIVLLEQDLGVLIHGVREGRITFANTLKYVFMATSANFGNMFSMAGASLFLPFLPLLPKQILLTNLLTDFPEMTIATDNVDPEMIKSPRRWDIAFIRRFMLVFGLLSSAFDFLTFGVLRLLLHAGPQEFRTGWFIESVISASMIVLVIRSQRPFYASRPSRSLFLATVAVVGCTWVLPFTELGRIFGFGVVPWSFALAVCGILVVYVGAAEITKHFFYRVGVSEKVSSRAQPIPNFMSPPEGEISLAHECRELPQSPNISPANPNCDPSRVIPRS